MFLPGWGTNFGPTGRCGSLGFGPFARKQILTLGMFYKRKCIVQFFPLQTYSKLAMNRRALTEIFNSRRNPAEILEF